MRVLFDIYIAFSQRPISILRIGQTAADLAWDGDGPALTPTGIAPLPDGRILPSRSGNRARILVLAGGKQPTPLVETEEDTLAPMTAVGSRQAAVVIGSGATADIAIVESSTGRIVERFPAPPQLTSLAASPDGTTLYATAGGTLSVLPRKDSQARTVGAGDSVTVDPATGDLIVKLDEQERFKLVRIPAAGGEPRPVPFADDFRLIPNPLMPGAIRDNQLVLPLSTADSWDWHAGVVDLRTGRVERLAANYRTDFQYVTRAADGTPIGMGLGYETTLWKFASRGDQD
jgi:hypothetical protein